ncbi:MAG: hypothetical protein U0872_11635 [Planctomycetaceae bacterium]
MIATFGRAFGLSLRAGIAALRRRVIPMLTASAESRSGIDAADRSIATDAKVDSTAASGEKLRHCERQYQRKSEHGVLLFRDHGLFKVIGVRKIGQSEKDDTRGKLSPD